MVTSNMSASNGSKRTVFTYDGRETCADWQDIPDKGILTLQFPGCIFERGEICARDSRVDYSREKVAVDDLSFHVEGPWNTYTTIAFSGGCLTSAHAFSGGMSPLSPQAGFTFWLALSAALRTDRAVPLQYRNELERVQDVGAPAFAAYLECAYELHGPPDLAGDCLPLEVRALYHPELLEG